MDKELHFLTYTPFISQKTFKSVQRIIPDSVLWYFVDNNIRFIQYLYPCNPKR